MTAPARRCSGPSGKSNKQAQPQTAPSGLQGPGVFLYVQTWNEPRLRCYAGLAPFFGNGHSIHTEEARKVNERQGVKTALLWETTLPVNIAHAGAHWEWKRGAGEGTRTPDPIITNDVLYQLSYTGTSRMRPKSPDPSLCGGLIAPPPGIV